MRELREHVKISPAKEEDIFPSISNVDGDKTHEKERLKEEPTHSDRNLPGSTILQHEQHEI